MSKFAKLINESGVNAIQEGSYVRVQLDSSAADAGDFAVLGQAMTDGLRQNGFELLLDGVLHSSIASEAGAVLSASVLSEPFAALPAGSAGQVLSVKVKWLQADDLAQEVEIPAASLFLANEDPAAIDASSLPSHYVGGMLAGRVKVDTTQIKHRLHTADFANGGYKPSEPSTESAEADYKPYAPAGMVTALRQAAEGGDSSLKTIPFNVELDMIEAQLARMLDADLTVAFDQASPVWEASNNSGSPKLKALGQMEVSTDLEVGSDAQVGRDLSVSNDATVGQDLAVAADSSVGGDLHVTGNITGDADLEITGTSQLIGDVTAQSDLAVSGYADIEGNVTVAQNLTVDGTSTLTGQVTAKADVRVNGDMELDGSFDFDGSTFDVDADGLVSIQTTSADGASNSAIEILATQGSVKIQGSTGIEFDGQTSFDDDVTITDSLTLQSDDAAKPDFIIKHDGVDMVKFDSTAGAMDAEITGDLTVNGSLTVADALNVDGAVLSVDANIATFSDNIIEVNKDQEGSGVAGIEFDGAAASGELDYFFGVDQALGRFMATREQAAGGWDDQADSLKIDLVNGADAAELHVGALRVEGIADIESDLEVGSTLSVSSAQVDITGDAIISEKLQVEHELDVDGDADIAGGLAVEGKFQADYDGAAYALTVHSARGGLSGVESATLVGEDDVDRLKLQTEDDDGNGNVGANIDLVGDMKLEKLLAQDMVVLGEFQAHSQVGLGASGVKTRVYGGLAVEQDAEFKSSLKVDSDGSSFALVADTSAQSNGLSIESSALDENGDEIPEYRALKAGSDAFFTLGDDKDMLLQGNLGVMGDAIFGGDVWLTGKLASKEQMVIQDVHTAGQLYSVPKADGTGFEDKNLFGITFAGEAAQITSVLQNAPASEAIVQIDGQDHISIMGILSGIISGGSTVRAELVTTQDYDIAEAIVIRGSDGEPMAIHDNVGGDAYKSQMRVYINGQRQTDDDYNLVTGSEVDSDGNAIPGCKISFNLVIEDDDIVIIDVNDANPAA